MNVFKVHQGYRWKGMNYGLPVWFVEFGFGASYSALELAKMLVNKGIEQNSWVVLVGNPLTVNGIAAFVNIMFKAGVKLELEEDGTTKEPPWLSSVDRWVVHYRPDATFNYMSLRPRRDIIIYERDNVKGFLDATSEAQAIRAVVTDYASDVWELVKGTNVRVYPRLMV